MEAFIFMTTGSNVFPGTSSRGAYFAFFLGSIVLVSMTTASLPDTDGPFLASNVSTDIFAEVPGEAAASTAVSLHREAPGPPVPPVAAAEDRGNGSVNATAGGARLPDGSPTPTDAVRFLPSPTDHATPPTPQPSQSTFSGAALLRDAGPENSPASPEGSLRPLTLSHLHGTSDLTAPGVLNWGPPGPSGPPGISASGPAGAHVSQGGSASSRDSSPVGLSLPELPAGGDPAQGIHLLLKPPELAPSYVPLIRPHSATDRAELTMVLHEEFFPTSTVEGDWGSGDYLETMSFTGPEGDDFSLVTSLPNDVNEAEDFRTEVYDTAFPSRAVPSLSSLHALSYPGLTSLLGAAHSILPTSVLHPQGRPTAESVFPPLADEGPDWADGFTLEPTEILLPDMNSLEYYTTLQAKENASSAEHRGNLTFLNESIGTTHVAPTGSFIIHPGTALTASRSVSIPLPDNSSWAEEASADMSGSEPLNSTSVDSAGTVRPYLVNASEPVLEPSGTPTLSMALSTSAVQTEMASTSSSRATSDTPLVSAPPTVAANLSVSATDVPQGFASSTSAATLPDPTANTAAPELTSPALVPPPPTGTVPGWAGTSDVTAVVDEDAAGEGVTPGPPLTTDTGGHVTTDANAPLTTVSGGQPTTVADVRLTTLGEAVATGTPISKGPLMTTFRTPQSTATRQYHCNITKPDMYLVQVGLPTGSTTGYAKSYIREILKSEFNRSVELQVVKAPPDFVFRVVSGPVVYAAVAVINALRQFARGSTSILTVSPIAAVPDHRFLVHTVLQFVPSHVDVRVCNFSERIERGLTMAYASVRRRSHESTDFTVDILNVTMSVPEFQWQQSAPVDITFAVRDAAGYLKGSEVSHHLRMLSVVEFSFYLGFPVLQIAEPLHYPELNVTHLLRSSWVRTVLLGVPDRWSSERTFPASMERRLAQLLGEVVAPARRWRRATSVGNNSVQIVRLSRLEGPDYPLEMVYFVEGPAGQRLPAATTSSMLNRIYLQRAAIVLGYRVQGPVAEPVERLAVPPSETQNNNMWIIVGVVVPVLLVVLIIVILYWKLCRSDKLEFQPDAMTAIQQRQKSDTTLQESRLPLKSRTSFESSEEEEEEEGGEEEEGDDEEEEEEEGDDDEEEEEEEGDEEEEESHATLRKSTLPFQSRDEMGDRGGKKHIGAKEDKVKEKAIKQQKIKGMKMNQEEKEMVVMMVNGITMNQEEVVMKVNGITMNQEEKVVVMKRNQEEMVVRKANGMKMNQEEKEMVFRKANGMKMNQKEKEMVVRKANGMKMNQEEKEMVFRKANGMKMNQEEKEMVVRKANRMKMNREEKEMVFRKANGMKMNQEEKEMVVRKANGMKMNQEEKEMVFRKANGMKMNQEEKEMVFRKVNGMKMNQEVVVRNVKGMAMDQEEKKVVEKEKEKWNGVNGSLEKIKKLQAPSVKGFDFAKLHLGQHSKDDIMVIQEPAPPLVPVKEVTPSENGDMPTPKSKVSSTKGSRAARRRGRISPSDADSMASEPSSTRESTEETMRSPAIANEGKAPRKTPKNGAPAMNGADEQLTSGSIFEHVDRMSRTSDGTRRVPNRIQLIAMQPMPAPPQHSPVVTERVADGARINREIQVALRHKSEIEHHRNKIRLRAKRRGHYDFPAMDDIMDSFGNPKEHQHIYEKAQLQIDKILDPAAHVPHVLMEPRKSARGRRSPKQRKKHQLNGSLTGADKDRLITTDSDGTYRKYPGVNNVAYVSDPDQPADPQSPSPTDEVFVSPGSPPPGHAPPPPSYAPPQPSIEEARQQMHSLLDDAFALVSPTSQGSNTGVSLAGGNSGLSRAAQWGSPYPAAPPALSPFSARFGESGMLPSVQGLSQRQGLGSDYLSPEDPVKGEQLQPDSLYSGRPIYTEETPSSARPRPVGGTTGAQLHHLTQVGLSSRIGAYPGAARASSNQTGDSSWGRYHSEDDYSRAIPSRDQVLGFPDYSSPSVFQVPRTSPREPTAPRFDASGAGYPSAPCEETSSPPHSSASLIKAIREELMRLSQKQSPVPSYHS